MHVIVFSEAVRDGVEKSEIVSANSVSSMFSNYTPVCLSTIAAIERQ